MPKSFRVNPIFRVANTGQITLIEGLAKVETSVMDESHGIWHADLGFQPKIDGVLEFDNGKDLSSFAADEPDVHYRLEKSARLAALLPT